MYGANHAVMLRPAPGGPVVRYRAGDGTELFRVELDMVSRIVRTRTTGYWTIDEADDYLAVVHSRVVTIRSLFGHAKMLVDRRGTPVQAVEVADRLGKANASLSNDRDRLALVVDSNLIKLQMRRLFVHPGSKAFLSYEAAELWLSAWP